MQVSELFKQSNTILLDGGMGTMLQAAGLKLGARPEELNITDPQLIEGIHAQYAAAGSRIINANTFGASAHKLAGSAYSLEEIIAAGIANCKRACAPYGALAALDVGPLGELLEPNGTLAFEDAVEEYARIVREKRMLRDLQQICSEIFELTRNEQESAGAIAELAEQKIYAIRRGRSAQSMATIQVVLQEVMEHLAELSAQGGKTLQGREINGLRHIKNVIKDVYDQLDELAANPGKLPGIPTGFSDLDNALGGLNKSDLILIAARPGMGKTSFALNLVLSAAQKSGKDVAVFQLEMSDMQLTTRMISSEALVDSRKLRMGTLDDSDWEKIAHASSILSKTNIYIEDSSAITVSEIKAKCRRMGSRLGLIVIDYLQLMQGSKSSENRVQQISEISRSLKVMARELNVPVVCLSQLSRGPEQRPNKRPMLSDLRESGAIEQDADIVMFLYREDYYEKESENHNLAECIIAKNRHGETRTVELQWLPEYTTFSSIDRRHSEY